jgi:cystathionine beta-lyase/cystathionine gamma-synthase
MLSLKSRRRIEQLFLVYGLTGFACRQPRWATFTRGVTPYRIAPQPLPRRTSESGINEGLVRISAGIEDVNDIIADLEQPKAISGERSWS